MRAYPANLLPNPDGGFTVTFRDVPEAITEGDSREEALLRAEDALESALAIYVASKEALPVPSAAQAGEIMVPLSALGMAKAALYEAMCEQVSAEPSWRAASAGIFHRSPASSTCVTAQRWNKLKPPSPPSAYDLLSMWRGQPEQLQARLLPSFSSNSSLRRM